MTLYCLNTHIYIHTYLIFPAVENEATLKKWEFMFGEMPLCPLKSGHILGNSGIVQLWCNVKILLWSSLIAWRLCYQWCITWFGFLSGCCDKILWQKATTERKSRQWASEVAAHMTSTATSREQCAKNVCTLVLSSLSPSCVIRGTLPREWSHPQWADFPTDEDYLGQQNLSSPSLRLSSSMIIDCVNLTMKTQHPITTVASAMEFGG